MSFPEHATFGDLLGPAMEIANQQEADEYFKKLVEYTMQCLLISQSAAEKHIRSNMWSYSAMASRNDDHMRLIRKLFCRGYLRDCGYDEPDWDKEAVKKEDIKQKMSGDPYIEIVRCYRVQAGIYNDFDVADVSFVRGLSETDEETPENITLTVKGWNGQYIPGRDYVLTIRELSGTPYSE